MKPTIKKIKELDDDTIYEITREGSEEKVQIMIPWEYINNMEYKIIGLPRSFIRAPYGLNFVTHGHYE